eukprot:1562372-Alexandrium_andersonii.AAC.1
MSASLVGSEMCIRDRSKTLLNAPKGGPIRPKGGAVRRQTRNSETLNMPPVSYTHLTLPTICSV